MKALNTAQCKLTTMLITCGGTLWHSKSHCNKHHSKVNISCPRYTQVCICMCAHIQWNIVYVRVLFSYALLHLLFISLQITVHRTIVWKISLITLTANLILLKHTYPSECHMLFSMILCVNQDNMFSDH